MRIEFYLIILSVFSVLTWYKRWRMEKDSGAEMGKNTGRDILNS